MVWEKEKIVGSCIFGGAVFAVVAAFFHLFLKVTAFPGIFTTMNERIIENAPTPPARALQ